MPAAREPAHMNGCGPWPQKRKPGRHCSEVSVTIYCETCKENNHMQGRERALFWFV